MQPQQGYGAQQYGQGGYGQPAPAPGQMGMVPGGTGGAMMNVGDGTNGPKGQVRKGTTIVLYSILSLGIYSLIWFISITGEMKAFLKREEPNWLKVIGLSVVTCNLYGLYWFATKFGALIGEIQQRAGVQNPQNLGWMYIIPYYNIILATEELNKAWQVPG
jgi:hypothetical protein